VWWQQEIRLEAMPWGLSLKESCWNLKVLFLIKLIKTTYVLGVKGKGKKKNEN